MKHLFETQDDQKTATLVVAAVVLHGLVASGRTTEVTRAQVIAEAFGLAEDFIAEGVRRLGP